jgi:metal-dependent hydrolase (beta-lactamase superfamily II)
MKNDLGFSLRGGMPPLSCLIRVQAAEDMLLERGLPRVGGCHCCELREENQLSQSCSVKALI